MCDNAAYIHLLIYTEFPIKVFYCLETVILKSNFCFITNKRNESIHTAKHRGNITLQKYMFHVDLELTWVNNVFYI